MLKLFDGYSRRVGDGLSLDDAEPFASLVAQCADIAESAYGAAN
jgi:hypothetical protein